VVASSTAACKTKSASSECTVSVVRLRVHC
jgi:hypothetical protein